MSANLTAATLNSLHRDADRVALRIIRTCGIPQYEREDLRQDLLVDFLHRMKHFDLCRGGIGAFAGACFAHRATRLMQRIQRGRAALAPTSLDDCRSSVSGQTHADVLAEEEGYSAWMGQPTDAAAAVEQLLDIQRAIASLPVEQRVHCRRLAADDTPRSLCSRSTEFRRTVELRLSLLARGIVCPA
jgi:DNA-directed RNA polymerase specialized sigma24 family protein